MKTKIGKKKNTKRITHIPTHVDIMADKPSINTPNISCHCLTATQVLILDIGNQRERHILIPPKPGCNKQHPLQASLSIHHSVPRTGSKRWKVGRKVRKDAAKCLGLRGAPLQIHNPAHPTAKPEQHKGVPHL